MLFIFPNKLVAIVSEFAFWLAEDAEEPDCILACKPVTPPAYPPETVLLMVGDEELILGETSPAVLPSKSPVSVTEAEITSPLLLIPKENFGCL